MLLFTLGLNACVAAGAFVFPIPELRTLLLVCVLILIEFVVTKQFRAACALLCWLWFYIRQQFIPASIIPDAFGLMSASVILIGLWVGLGVERNQNEGRIRPGLIVMTFALYFLPFQPKLDHPAISALLSVWYFSVYAVTCWIKDRVEDEIVTTFYFVMSAYWVLLADVHWVFLVVRVAYSALLCRAALPMLGVLQDGAYVDAGPTTVASKHPAAAETMKKKSASMPRRAGSTSRALAHKPKREFTLKDGFHLGLRLLQEDELISAMIDERTRQQYVRHQLQFQQHTQTVVSNDDPAVLENEQKYAI